MAETRAGLVAGPWPGLLWGDVVRLRIPWGQEQGPGSLVRCQPRGHPEGRRQQVPAPCPHLGVALVAPHPTEPFPHPWDKDPTHPAGPAPAHGRPPQVRLNEEWVGPGTQVAWSQWCGPHGAWYPGSLPPIPPPFQAQGSCSNRLVPTCHSSCRFALVATLSEGVPGATWPPFQVRA